MNPMQKMQQIGNFVKAMKNPQQTMVDMLSNNTNPVTKNVLKMVQNGDYQGIEQFARNIVAEKGKNFDEEFANFRNMTGL